MKYVVKGYVKLSVEVTVESDNGYIHYLRLFAKKWVRKREEE